MKPRKLKIKGLNSFIEEQEIDFQRLTDKGLFGIFGPTGSGKSTILDAITMALYGSISRESKDFINTSATSLLVSYEFEIGAGSERKVYIADRVVNKDKAGSPKLKASRLREICDGNDIPIAEGSNEVKSTVEKIIGLTADDFTRSVVLPQGKFSEFLKLTGKDRRNMLERIFRLEKFGKNLGDRIRIYKREKNDSLNILTGRIGSYEQRGVSEEKYNSLMAELRQLTQEQESTKKEKLRLDSEYEKYKVVWELQEELAVYRTREKELEERVREIELKKQKLLNARNAENIKPTVEELKSLESNIKANEEELHKAYSQLEQMKTQIAKTEEEYKIWAEKKDKELHVLIEKETNLARAIELEEKLKVIEAEITALRQDFQVKAKRRDALGEEINKLTQAKEASTVEKEKVEKRLEEIKVDPEYRDKVQKASQVEDEYLSVLREKKELEDKCTNKATRIRTLELEHKQVLNHQEQYCRELAITEEKIEELVRSVPGENTELIEMKEKIARLEAKIKELEAYISRRAELEGKSAAALKEKEEIEKSISETTKLMDMKKEELAHLELEIRNIERNNLASILSGELKDEDACPVCGSVHHPHLAEAFDEGLLKDKKTLKESLEKAIVQMDKSLRKLEVSHGTVINSESFIRKDLEDIRNKIGSLDIEALRREKFEFEEKFKELSSRLQEWNRNKELTEKNLNKVKEEKSSIDKNEVKLTENLKGERSALEELEAALRKLSEKCSELDSQYRAFKEELKLENIKDKVRELKELEKEALTLQKSLKELTDTINRNDKLKEAKNKELGDLQVELAKITESGKEKKAVIDRERDEINKLSEGKNPKEFIAFVRDSKKTIIENEEKLRNRLEKEKDERQKLSDRILSAEATKSNLQASRRNQEERLKDLLNLYGFLDIEQVRSSLMPQNLIENMEKEIKSFEDNVKNTKDNIDRVTNKLASSSIDEESWIKLQESRTEAAEALEAKVRLIAQKSHSIKQIEKELEELKELNVKKKELEHVCSNLDDLAKLVEGNKFVEFVAMNQLKYISLEASKRLKDITRGRYALEIDSTGNFIMRDDFNGGTRRATSTLSGGETFLTSLCLALSLSSQIQLKGSAPLEFFFLDEGFGTLDSDLLETVMGSLERLHSDRLCVGIISHVEELKNRVPIKLLVEPAEHGKSGSRVRVELS